MKNKKTIMTTRLEPPDLEFDLSYIPLPPAIAGSIVALNACPKCATGMVRVRRNVGHYEYDCQNCPWHETRFIELPTTRAPKTATKTCGTTRRRARKSA